MILNQYLQKYTFITIPGLGGSGEEHWHTFWEKQYPEIIRVEQRDWDQPLRHEWVDQLIQVINQNNEKPIILIGHSLGCGTIIHAANEQKLTNVKAAFLVALPDIERGDFPKECVGFSPVPRIKLPFKSVLIASENDPYVSIEKINEWADIIGSTMINVGKKEHIGSSAQLSNWEEGQRILHEFLNSSESQIGSEL